MWECISLATEGRGYERSLFVSALHILPLQYLMFIN